MSSTNTNEQKLPSALPPLPPSIEEKIRPRVLSRFDTLLPEVLAPMTSQKYFGVDEAFWQKLTRAANGTESLEAADAKRIVDLLKADGENATESKIVSLIVNRLKGSEDILEQGFLRYLSENFNKLVVGEGQDAEGEGTPRSPVFTNGVMGYDFPNSPQLERLPSKIVEVLKQAGSWNFDMFLLQELTPCPLETICFHALKEYSLIDSLQFNSTKLSAFLRVIHDAYNPQPYHNAIHAADVTQTTFYLLSSGNVLEALKLNQISVASLLIAAAIHDVGHPGLNGKFLITTNSPLAIQYNDKSPLEMMHLATAYRFWKQDEYNFTENISVTVNREMRRLIVEMVLMTDNDMHFSLLNRLDRTITVHSNPELSSGGSGRVLDSIGSAESTNILSQKLSLSHRTPASHPTTDDRQLLMLQVTLHTADVSNTAKPWPTYIRWMEALMEEFYRQGDKERELGMPISYAFDRQNPVTQSKFQLGFIKAIVGPLYKTFSKVEGVTLSECLSQLSSNARRWKELVAEEEDPSPIKATPSGEGEEGGSPGGGRVISARTEKKMQRRVSPIVFDIRHTQASPLTLDDPISS